MIASFGNIGPDSDSGPTKSGWTACHPRVSVLKVGHRILGYSYPLCFSNWDRLPAYAIWNILEISAAFTNHVNAAPPGEDSHNKLHQSRHWL